MQANAKIAHTHNRPFKFGSSFLKGFKLYYKKIKMEAPTNITIKGILGLLTANTDGCKQVISLGMGDPTAYSCFRTTRAAQNSVVEALQSAKFNGYSPTVGLPQTRKY